MDRLIQISVKPFPISFGRAFESFIVPDFLPLTTERDQTAGIRPDEELITATFLLCEFHVEVLGDLRIAHVDRMRRIILFSNACNTTASIAYEELQSVFSQNLAG